MSQPDLLHPSLAAVPDDQDPDLLIQPGAPPPFVLPWCASCKTTVDRFTIDPLKSDLWMGIEAECHGATEAIRVGLDDLMARKRLGKPVVMFRRGAFDRVR